MNHQPLQDNQQSPELTPCLVLRNLQSDLSGLLKSKTWPFSSVYRLSEDAFIEISVQKLDDGQFQLNINSSSGSKTATEAKLARLVDLAHMFAWRYLSQSLSSITILPCASAVHGGADEVLALYKSFHDFQKAPELPHTLSMNSPRGAYELFCVRQNGMLCEIAIETNFIYGNTMKWRAEVEFLHQVEPRVSKMISDVLGEWLRPGGAALRVQLDRELNLSRPKPATTTT